MLGAYTIPATVFNADGGNIAFFPAHKIDNRIRMRTPPSVEVSLIIFPRPVLIPRSWLVAAMAQAEPFRPVRSLYQFISTTPIVFASHRCCFLPVDLSLRKTRRVTVGLSPCPPRGPTLRTASTRRTVRPHSIPRAASIRRCHRCQFRVAFDPKRTRGRSCQNLRTPQ